MFQAGDLPDTLPMFPLPGALLLPRARLPLHVFEPRYLAMLDDVLKTSHRLIGMVQPRPGQEGEVPPLLHDVGCAGRVTAFSETNDGRYMITLTGISRFRSLREQSGFQPYRKCDVRWQEFTRDLGPAESDPGFDRTRFMDLLGRYFQIQELKTDWESLQSADDEMLINSLSMLVPLEPEDRQALLEANSLVQRRETLETLLDFAVRSGRGEETMQ
jgi:hypothetical protein